MEKKLNLFFQEIGQEERERVSHQPFIPFYNLVTVYCSKGSHLQ